MAGLGFPHASDGQCARGKTLQQTELDELSQAPIFLVSKKDRKK
jgi:hypothetical protein